MIITYGILLKNAMEAADMLKDRGLETAVLRLMSLSELPVERILEEAGSCRQFAIVEDCCAGSGIYEAIAEQILNKIPGAVVQRMDLGHGFVSHGPVDQLHVKCGLDAQSIAEKILEVRKVEN